MKYFSLYLGVCALALSGCTAVGTAIGVGASAGIAASQEGGISRAVDDARIQIEINDLWFKYSVEAFRKLDLTINNGRVLLTGVVQNPEHRVEAVRLAWQPDGVSQVINEIQVAESEGITGFAKDAWITTRLRTALTFEPDVESINYSIDTVQGAVYLMGFANSEQELNRVVEIARTIGGVQNVVSYVQVYQSRDDYVPGNDMPRTEKLNNKPVSIAPQAQPHYGRPYIERQPVEQQNIDARSAQQERVQAHHKQDIEREVIQWNN